jgi:hypothetical protein
MAGRMLVDHEQLAGFWNPQSTEGFRGGPGRTLVTVTIKASPGVVRSGIYPS